jgi:hypothetical protein
MNHGHDCRVAARNTLAGSQQTPTTIFNSYGPPVVVVIGLLSSQ